MENSKEISKFLDRKLPIPEKPPLTFCPKHPTQFITHYCPQKKSFYCGDCLPPSPLYKNSSLLSVFEMFTQNWSLFQLKIKEFLIDLSKIQETQINLFGAFKEKFNKIFDQYEDDCSLYFQKIKENIINDLDCDTIFIAHEALTSKKELDYEDFSEKISFLMKSLDSKSSKELSLDDRVGIFLEQSKIFTNEMSIFLTDSLETLKKSYQSFSTSSLERILKQKKIRHRCSSLNKEVVMQWSHPQKTLEINGSTPFAKDIALIGGDKNDYVFCTCSNDEKIRVWKLNSENFCESVDTLTGHTDWVNRMIFDEERGLLLSSARDHTIIVWDSHTWKRVILHIFLFLNMIRSTF